VGGERMGGAGGVAAWYLSKSVGHFSHARFAFSPVESKEHVRFGSGRHLESGVNVDQILKLVLVVVVNQRLHGPLQAPKPRPPHVNQMSTTKRN